jgi:hypothetical protein
MGQVHTITLSWLESLLLDSKVILSPVRLVELLLGESFIDPTRRKLIIILLLVAVILIVRAVIVLYLPQTGLSQGKGPYTAGPTPPTT